MLAQKLCRRRSMLHARDVHVEDEARKAHVISFDAAVTCQKCLLFVIRIALHFTYNAAPCTPARNHTYQLNHITTRQSVRLETRSVRLLRRRPHRRTQMARRPEP
jgi:hypothetical protein